MGLFNYSKKKAEEIKIAGPYNNDAINLMYHLLFCDNLDLFKKNIKEPYTYPFDILFSQTSTVTDLQNIIDDSSADPRIKALAYKRQFDSGHKPEKKEILAVIVEVGLDLGLDVLASFSNGTARYINQTGKMIIWETTDERSGELTRDLFEKSKQIISQIGPWDKPRRPQPSQGNMRISFVVSDGLYFGEAPINTLFNDPLAKPALTTATELMQYITNKDLEANKK